MSCGTDQAAPVFDVHARCSFGWLPSALAGRLGQRARAKFGGIAFAAGCQAQNAKRDFGLRYSGFLLGREVRPGVVENLSQQHHSLVVVGPAVRHEHHSVHWLPAHRSIARATGRVMSNELILSKVRVYRVGHLVD
jgi:hypothetical protein